MHAGGYDLLGGGDGSWPIPGDAWNEWGNTRLVESSYNYRLVPSNSFGAGWSPVQLRVLGVKPDRYVWNGEPFFKTEKQLGARSVVCDTFSRQAGYDPTDFPVPPGMGFWAHKVGYNVLYGDGHCAYYNDPQQQIAWWTVTGTGPSGSSYDFNCAILEALNCDWGARPDDIGPQAPYAGDAQLYPYCGPNNGNGSTLVWHLFDKSQDIDVGVDEAFLGE
jgi:prepilin-type processing-associated H-X9-DG protein